MNVAFVAPYLLPATARFAAETAALAGVRTWLITQEPLERVPDELRARLAGHRRVANALDPAELVAAVREIANETGKVERLFGVLEHLQEPVAEARQELEIEGMPPHVARNFRDKARMKTVLHEAGLPCARHLLVSDVEAAGAFAAEVGFPLVVKPPEGAGARGTFRVDGDLALGQALQVTRPTPERPVLLEEFVTGEEFSFDSVLIGGKPVWFSTTEYLPTPLEVLRNPWMQWCAMVPREVDDERFAEIRDLGPQAVRALGLETGLSHMEWFRTPSGKLAISEVGARPPGAQISSLISYAHDFDLYRAWPELMVFGTFEPPPRRYAAGVAFLRGRGDGRVRTVRGLDRAQHELGELAVEVKLPKPGQPASGTYEGEGYAILRHPETAVVREALRRLVSIVQVEMG